MNYLVVSCSGNPGSRSRVLAKFAHHLLEDAGHHPQWLDLAEHDIPICDGDAAFRHEIVDTLCEAVRGADGILLASPIYNYDVNAGAKNLIELTGRAWADKVAGFMLAAGGHGSYMAVMSLANSLMLDFRTVIIPRFVYATSSDFKGDDVEDLDLRERVERLAADLVRFTSALRGQ